MDLLLILIILLTIGGLSIPALDLLFAKYKNLASQIICISILLLSIFLLIIPVINPTLLYTDYPSLFNFDYLGIFFSITVIIVVILVAISSLSYQKNDENVAVYYSLLIFTTLGMVLLSFSIDLLMIFVAWQLMSIPTFILTGFKKNSVLSNEAAVKFFILGAFSSGILLYGISLVYGLIGSTNLYDMVNFYSTLPNGLEPIAYLSIILLIAGLGLKMAIVPFHMWLPDALAGAPTPISALLSAATKKSAFIVAIRVFLLAVPISAIGLKMDLMLTISILALITMTVGNIAALTQKSIKRLLAYSSIAHAGYILIGLAVGTQIGLVGLLYHVFNHGIMTSAAFIAVAVILKQGFKDDVKELNGLGKIMPVTAALFTIILLALAGVPPLNGFWSKFILFTAAVDSNLAWLAVAGALNSAFSLGYYGWFIKRFYIDDPDSTNKTKIYEKSSFLIPLLIAVIIIVITGLFPYIIYDFALKAVVSL